MRNYQQKAQRHRKHCATRKQEQPLLLLGVFKHAHAKTALPLVELRLPRSVDNASQKFDHAEPNQAQRYAEALAQQQTCDKIPVDSWTGLAKSVHKSFRKKLPRGARTHHLNDSFKFRGIGATPLTCDILPGNLWNDDFHGRLHKICRFLLKKNHSSLKRSFSKPEELAHRRQTHHFLVFFQNHIFSFSNLRLNLLIQLTMISLVTFRRSRIN